MDLHDLLLSVVILGVYKPSQVLAWTSLEDRVEPLSPVIIPETSTYYLSSSSSSSHLSSLSNPPRIFVFGSNLTASSGNGEGPFAL